jgi:hypothetical protein
MFYSAFRGVRRKEHRFWWRSTRKTVRWSGHVRPEEAMWHWPENKGWVLLGIQLVETRNCAKDEVCPTQEKESELTR